MLIPCLHRNIPAVLIGVITAEAQQVARRRSVNLRHGHPIVSGQRKIAHTHLLHILRHARIARLHTHRGTEKIGRRHARFYRKIVFAVHQEVGQTQTRIHPPCFRGAPFGIAVQRRLVPLHHLLAIRFVQDCRLTTIRDAVFGRKTVVGVVQAEAQSQGQLRCPHPLRARIPIVDAVVNFLIKVIVAVTLQPGTTRFVVEGEMTLRTVARIGQSEVVHPMLAQRQLPFERGEAVAPTHAHFIFVAHLVFRRFGRLVPTVRSR